MTKQAPRPIPLGLTALVALFSALVALAISSGHTAHAHDTRATTGSITAKELALRNSMRAV
jgi:hypothetical protein